MAPYSYIYLFSVGTVYIILAHIYNVLLFKKRGRDLLGKNFKQGTIERQRMLQLADRNYMSIAIGGVLFSVVLSAISGVKIWLISERGDALIALCVIPVTALAVVGIIVCYLKLVLGKKAAK